MPGPRSDGTTPTPAERGKARAVVRRLEERYPEIHTALDYENPWQLLVVTVMSAQTTDENVNGVAPLLFEEYPEPTDLAEANPEDVEQIIFSTGFYRQKTKSIIALSNALVEEHDGVVPDDRDLLVKLPGVGRKTANVVLAEAWGRPAIAVDTHVNRISNRLELTTEKDPVKIEKDLESLIPKKSWPGLSMRMIQFGRDVCIARSPRCGICELAPICPSAGTFD